MVKPPINLLVVDDDAINVYLIKKIIEKTGYNVVTESKPNGEAALDYLTDLIKNNGTFPNLILVDINMPILNGWEFIEAYQKLETNYTPSMFMLSSSIFDSDIEKSKLYSSVKGFITKPLGLDYLKNLFATLEEAS